MVKIAADLGHYPGVVFDLLTEPRRLLEDAVRVQSVDHVFNAQALRLLVFISCESINPETLF